MNRSAHPGSANCPDCTDFAQYCDNVIVCRNCGLGRTTTALEPPDEQDYMSGTDSEIESRRKYFIRIRDGYLPGLRAGRSLDIGCGRGQFVEVLLEAGWDAYGLDAYRGLNVSDRILKGTVDSLDTDESYDLISMVHSFEHMARPVGVLAKVAQMLKGDGTLLVVVPNFGGVWSTSCGSNWDTLDTGRHAYHYTVKALDNLLLRAGFNLRGTYTYSGYAPSPWQARLGARRFYERGWGSLQPFRSLIFRANAMVRPVVNAYLDLRKRGAEIVALASRRAS